MSNSMSPRSTGTEWNRCELWREILEFIKCILETLVTQIFFIVYSQGRHGQTGLPGLRGLTGEAGIAGRPVRIIETIPILLLSQLKILILRPSFRVFLDLEDKMVSLEFPEIRELCNI